MYRYGQHTGTAPFLESARPTGVELAEVDGGTHDDGTADNHGDGTRELASAALHAVLDGHAEVDEAEDDEDAAEERHALREHVDCVVEHSCYFLSEMLVDGWSPRGLEAREAVERREAGDRSASRNHGDCLPKLAAAPSRPVPQVHPEVDEAEEDDRAAYVGDGLRGEPDEFFQSPFTVLSFLPETRSLSAHRLPMRRRVM